MPGFDDRERRLYLVDASGRQFPMQIDSKDGSIILTGLQNANSAVPIMLHVAEQCDLQGWHVIGKTALPCWGS